MTLRRSILPSSSTRCLARTRSLGSPGGLRVTQQEIPLIGGNTSTVVKVGDTVRRNVVPRTPAAGPDNCVWRQDSTPAVIDFDLACPGARISGAAYAAGTWVPLFADRASYTLGWHHPNRPRRLRLFADAYGLVPRDRHRLVRTIRKRIVDHIEGIRRMAAAGDPAFVRIVHKGHLRRPVRDLRLIDYERHILEYALR